MGIVAIGRNEGNRLLSCLASVDSTTYPVVYVDSGSTDDSCNSAKSLGARVVQLDLSIPFTAARARNAGWRHLLELYPKLDFVHFVDGDCEFFNDWLETALLFLANKPEYATVCGRRVERYPEKSIYNRLCDIEWNTPVGDVKACGGDALYRLDALQQVGGFNDDLIAGEEPELCYRLRCCNWKIYRYDADMTRHDAAMFKAKQWWLRTMRAGYAYANGYALHGGKKAQLENYRWPEIMRVIIWAFYIPLLVLTLSLFTSWALLLALVYPLQILRLTKKYLPVLQNSSIAFLYAVSNVAGKFAELSGIAKYVVSRARGRKSKLIEYK